MERQPPRHNHHTHSHFNNSGSNNNNNNVNHNNNKRKQKTKHHHRSSNQKHHQQSPQEALPAAFNSHQTTLVTTPDQGHANYEYIMGDGSHCGDDDENSCNLGKVTISENEETTEHDDDEIGNSYSCDDTLTDDAILSGADRIDKSKRNHSHHCEQTSRDSGSGGETCCSCSDTSCVYEEPPSHPPPPPSAIQANQALRIGSEE
jgi:hypothetical protein